jgi:hypothetical protein
MFPSVFLTFSACISGFFMKCYVPTPWFYHRTNILQKGTNYEPPNYVILSTLLLLSHLKSKYFISVEKCILSAGSVHLLFHLTCCIATESNLYLLILMFLFSINLNYIDSWHKFQTVMHFCCFGYSKKCLSNYFSYMNNFKITGVCMERLLTFLYVMMVHVMLIPTQYMWI